jgi:polyphenol oxidase
LKLGICNLEFEPRASLVTEHLPIEEFQSLSNIGVCRHGFIKRIAGIDVSQEKAYALRALDAVHRKARSALGMGDWPLATAEQVHGNRLAVIDRAITSDQYFEDCDGFITMQRRIVLGVYVADCCAVYLVDPKTPAIGLVHSGRKGTELAIIESAIEQMTAQFGSDVTDLIVQLSPCIRPPHYDVDFAAQIIEQCRERGVGQLHDSGICTACDLDAYYSYRAEKGKTGRMLALLGLV